MKTWLGFLAILVLMMPAARAQSNTWDSMLAGSQWYVPAENVLAYMASSTDLTEVLPIGDQTLWNITTATNGVFSGTSKATFKIGESEVNTTTVMNGVVTDEGQIRIVFTGGTTIIGIGQVRELEGENYMEMQMITDVGGLSYVTHWAYMGAYNGEPNPLPLVPEPALLSEEWAWMEGTSWNLASDGIFGEGGTGTFQIDDYVNGYFWGTGTGDTGDFTLLGSATPEGNILFNILDDGVLTSLTGLITGTSSNGAMALRVYDSQAEFGDGALAQVVPEPAALALLGVAGLVLLGLRKRR